MSAVHHRAIPPGGPVRPAPAPQAPRSCAIGRRVDLAQQPLPRTDARSVRCVAKQRHRGLWDAHDLLPATDAGFDVPLLSPAPRASVAARPARPDTLRDLARWCSRWIQGEATTSRGRRGCVGNIARSCAQPTGQAHSPIQWRWRHGGGGWFYFRNRIAHADDGVYRIPCSKPAPALRDVVHRAHPRTAAAVAANDAPECVRCTAAAGLRTARLCARARALPRHSGALSLRPAPENRRLACTAGGVNNSSTSAAT